MKKHHLFLNFMTLALLLTLGLNSCKKDSTQTPMTLGTITAGSIDLNSATSPANVPVNPSIVATFATDVDSTTAKAANISLVEDYDTVSISLNIAVNGKTITITPKNNLANGALYKLMFTSGLKATNGLALTALERTFTTVGSFLPSGVVAYWNFDGNANDQTGTYNASASTDITYANGRNATAGQAAEFNGTTSLIEIPNGDALMNTGDFTLSFWVYEDTTAKRDQFVLGLAGWYGLQFEINSNIYGTPPAQIGQCKLAAQYSLSNNTTASQDLWFDGSGTTKDNGGWQGFTYCKNLVSNNGTGVNGLLAEKWAQVVCTYNSTTKIGIIYINGEEMKAQDFNLYGDPMDLATGLKYAGNAGNNSLVFGFIQDKNSPTIPDAWADYTDPANGHFKGMLDDVAFYHKALSQKLITQMYNSGKP